MAAAAATTATGATPDAVGITECLNTITENMENVDVIKDTFEKIGKLVMPLSENTIHLLPPVIEVVTRVLTIHKKSEEVCEKAIRVALYSIFLCCKNPTALNMGSLFELCSTLCDILSIHSTSDAICENALAIVDIVAHMRGGKPFIISRLIPRLVEFAKSDASEKMKIKSMSVLGHLLPEGKGALLDAKINETLIDLYDTMPGQVASSVADFFEKINGVNIVDYKTRESERLALSPPTNGARPRSQSRRLRKRGRKSERKRGRKSRRRT
jgi:hypothetical protein